jgi:hypothetical protein
MPTLADVMCNVMAHIKLIWVLSIVHNLCFKTHHKSHENTDMNYKCH